MKKTFTLIGSLLMFAFSGVAQQAQVQVVHNSADTAASQVDVYLGSNLLLDDFAFREASPFVDVPTTNDAVVSIAPANSNDSSDAIYKDTFTLSAGEKYRLVASGVLNPGNYAPNPNGVNTQFGLRVNAPAMNSANMDSVGIQAFHGVTDFGEATIELRDGPALVSGAQFNQFSSNITIEANDGVLDLRDANSDRIATFETPGFDTLGGKAGLLMASGFAMPSNNNMGEALALHYVKPNGEVYELQPVQNAFAQFVHNAPDPALDTVDVWINGIRILPGFSFHEATQYLPIQSESSIVFRAPGSSDTLAEFNNVSLTPADTYNVVASGVADPNNFTDNPDGRDIAFDLFINEGARTQSYNGNDRVDFNLFHGATDAPHIDVVNRASNQIVYDNIGYGDFGNYISIPSGDYFFDVTDSANNRVIHTIIEPENLLNTLLGSSAMIFASGFLEASENPGENEFQLMAALPNGDVDTLIALNFANVQITHNSPDPAVEQVDVYLNGQRAVQNLSFQASTPYVQLPANDSIEIGLAPGGSSGPGDIVATYERRLTSLRSYNLMAMGVTQPSSFPENPDGRNTGLALYTSNGRTGIPSQSRGADTIYTKLIHGVPDAPIANVSFPPYNIEGLVYRSSTQYVQAFAQEYDEVTFNDTASGETLLEFSGNLTDYADSAMITYASGFVTDTGDLAEFKLISVMPDGTNYTWSRTVGIEEEVSAADFGMGVYPNPAVSETKLSYSLDQNSDVGIAVFNNNGQMVKQIQVGEKATGAHNRKIDVSDLNSGLYHLQLKVGEEVKNAKLLVR